jgi:hypothetical protein
MRSSIEHAEDVHDLAVARRVPSFAVSFDTTRRAKRTAAYRRMLAAIDAHLERTGAAAEAPEPLPAAVLGYGPPGPT